MLAGTKLNIAGTKFIFVRSKLIAAGTKFIFVPTKSIFAGTNAAFEPLSGPFAHKFFADPRQVVLRAGRWITMANILPDDAAGRITFFEVHQQPWADHAVAIGVSGAAVAALGVRTAEARAAQTAQAVAYGQARSATLALQLAASAMTTAGTDLIRQIKAKAATDGPAVYSLALLPAPAKPSPTPPPGTPTAFTFTLNQTGALMIQWKCRNPRGSSGTMYEIARCIGADGPLVTLGVAGRKRFIDDTIPAGVRGITYQITARRSTAQGMPARFTVNFGVKAAGGAARLAA